MNAPAFTPGPWGAMDGAIYATQTEPIHSGKTCSECGHDPTECGDGVIVPISPDLIADIKAGYWDDCEAPKEHDLRLIAAAPELLSALQAAETVMREHGLQSRGEYKQITDALAKAVQP